MNRLFLHILLLSALARATLNTNGIGCRLPLPYLLELLLSWFDVHLIAFILSWQREDMDALILIEAPVVLFPLLLHLV